MKLSEKEMAEAISQLPSASFTNIYGEKFTIHSNGIRVFMGGNEVDAMVDEKNKFDNKYIELFNPHFGIWNNDELRKLGYALIDVSNKVDHE